MKWVCLLLLIAAANSLQAQDTGSVIVHKDARLNLLLKKQVEVNEFNTRDARRNVAGFRILVISTNDRNKANEAKLKVYRNFPELNAYLVYQSPYYKLRVGNFTNQKDAESYLKKIEVYFPNGVYVIRDIIEVNPDRSGDLQ